RLRRPGIIVLAICCVGLAGVAAYQIFGPRQPPAMVRTTRTIPTELYTVQLETYENPVPKSLVRGGAIAVVGEHYLLATGDGRLYVFAWPAGGKFVKPRLLPYRVPLDADAFIAASHTKWDESMINSDAAYALKGIQTWQFRVADVLVKEDGDHLQIFASHHHWHVKHHRF